MSKICVVTGSDGFIGKHLVKHLEDHGYEVRGFDIKNGSDINDIDRVEYLFDLWKPDYVFHLAGLADIVPSIKHPVEYMNTNVMGTVNVLEASRKAGVKKFVYAASSSSYGDNPFPTHENSKLNPKYPYALSKMMGEQVVMHWNQVYGLPCNSLRLYNVYGRGQNKSCYGAVFSTFMAQRANNQPLTIVGDGTQARDFIHVKDVCEAFRLAAETELSGEIWNVGTGQPRSIKYLANLISGNTVNIPDRPGEPRNTSAVCRKIFNDLGWTPKIEFRNGVDEMLDYLGDWKDNIVWTPEAIEKETKPWFDNLQRGR